MSNLARIEKLVESNAKAIEALTDDIKEFSRDRQEIYGMLKDLTNNQSRISDVMVNLDSRQQQLTNQQQQLIDILKTLAAEK